MNLASAAHAVDHTALLTAWRPLVDSLPDAAWIVDAQSHRVVLDNAAAQALLGRRGQSLVGSERRSADRHAGGSGLLGCRRIRCLWRAAIGHDAVRRGRSPPARDALHPTAGRRRRRARRPGQGAAPLPGGIERPQRDAPCRGRARTGRGRAAGDAGIHGRRHSGDRSGGPHPRLQPPFRGAVGDSRRPAAHAPGRRRARLDAPQRQRRRVLPAHPAQLAGGHAAQRHRAHHLALGTGAGARRAPVVVSRSAHGPGVFLPRPEPAARGAAAHRAAVADRCADRPAQPTPVGRARGQGLPALTPRRRRLRTAEHRPGPLSPDQRQPGPRDRRPCAHRRGAAHSRVHARGRPAGAHRRGPVRAAGRRRRPPGRGTQRAARARRGGRALQPGRRAVHAHLQHRRRAVPGQRPQCR